ncbi:MAG: GH36-type glycosyl hydrolase domain-containing protein, partial [Rhodanobacteraceae bacterium]
MPARDSAAPRVALLGDGDYAAMVTAAGAGWSRWKGLAITRWREDATGDGWGNWLYLRDIRSGDAWSPSPQPLGGDPRHIEVQLDEHAARFARREGSLTTTLEIAVDPDSALEVRGIGLRNDGDRPREIEITSYAELVLGSPQGDASHPAFSKMFVQTHVDDGVLLATRRKRDPSEPDVWAAHSVVVDGEAIGGLQYETDRARFVGRDRDLRSPQALDANGSLSGAVGTVLDPVFSLRVRVRVPPRITRRIAFVTAAAPSRREVLAAVARCGKPEACARVFAHAAAASRKKLRETDIDTERARVFRRLASALLYSDPALRASPGILAQGEGGAPLLWAKGISGDLAIALVRVGNARQLRIVRELLRAQGYWGAKQMPADLVILNEAVGDAAADLQSQLEALVARASGGKAPDKSGSVFALRGDEIDDRLRGGLMTVARIVLDGKNGDLEKQIADLQSPKELRESSFRRRDSFAIPGAGSRPDIGSTPMPRRVAGPSQSVAKELKAFTGLGGFSEDGGEYVTVLRQGASTPMPWSHLVANPDFGFLATTTGGGYCWVTNSQQNQINPWSNDAVRDPPSEVLYLRDTSSDALWSATASPIRVPGADYIARFGPGYVKYECAVDGIESELLQFVPVAGCVKISRLRLRNRSGRKRKIDVTAYVHWALGAIGT